jgi:hypothetical protein
MPVNKRHPATGQTTACALFRCGPASPAGTRTGAGGPGTGLAPCLGGHPGADPDARRVISRFDDSPSTVIACSSCSEAQSTRRPTAKLQARVSLAPANRVDGDGAEDEDQDRMA